MMEAQKHGQTEQVEGGRLPAAGDVFWTECCSEMVLCSWGSKKPTRESSLVFSRVTSVRREHVLPENETFSR